MSIIAGTKTWDIVEILWLISSELREQVEEITMDLFPTMRKAARFSICFRWDSLNEVNRKKARAKATGKDYESEVFENGDTRKQLLARSRYLLFKSAEKWTKSQKSGLRYPLTIIQTLKQPTT